MAATTSFVPFPLIFKVRVAKVHDEDISVQVRGQNTTYKKIKNIFSSYFVHSLAEYGPPYEYDAYYKGALLFECSQATVKSLDVHRLLNAKVDPNDVEENELNFTPMHWCAKHCHLNPMKMLVKAKAYINILNEFGQSPLGLCVMMNQTPNKMAVQQEMVEYLLELGADFEMRDKGGMSPLDYAVANGNVRLMHLILDFGATVRRDNMTFSVQRPLLLENVTDERCYRRIKDRLQKEMEVDRIKIADDEAATREREAFLAKQARIQNNIDKKEKRMNEIDRQKHQRAQDEILRVKVSKLSSQLSEEKAAKAVAAHSRGSWVQQNDENHKWIWHAKKAVIPLHISHDCIYSHGLKVAERVKARRSKAAVNMRWEAVTGSKLEVTWESMKAFDEIVEVKGHQNESQCVVEIATDRGSILLEDYKEPSDSDLEGEDLDFLQ